MSARRTGLIAAVSLALVCVGCAVDNKAAPTPNPDLPLSQNVMDQLLSPIPNLKVWKSTIPAKRLKEVWQFGNLRMSSWYGGDQPPGIPELLKKYHLTAVTHSAPANLT